MLGYKFSCASQRKKILVLVKYSWTVAGLFLCHSGIGGKIFSELSFAKFFRRFIAAWRAFFFTYRQDKISGKWTSATHCIFFVMRVRRVKKKRHICRLLFRFSLVYIPCLISKIFTSDYSVVVPSTLPRNFNRPCRPNQSIQSERRKKF